MNSPQEQRQTDAELVRAAQAGNRAKFDQLVARYHRPIYVYAYGRLRDRQSAEDATQEAFLRAYRGLEKCTEPTGFSPWLYRIATFCCQEARRANRKYAVSFGEESELPGEAGASAAETDGRKEFSEFVDALDMLSEDERLVLTWKHLEDLTCREISERTGKPIGTITSLLARAYERIRKHWSKSADEVR